MFQVKNRAYTDNDTPEVAGKLLPAHPINRYKSFSKLWQQTRKVGNYIPRPDACASKAEDYFPCCLKCAIPAADTDIKELLAHRSALAGWLMAEWVWDFGFTLPEEFVGLGIGITPPPMPVERDRVFIHKPNFSRGYLDVSLEEHAQCKGEQHEAKFRIGFTGNVNYPGEMMCTSSGQIYIATPRTVPFGAGKSVMERFIFQPVQMPYDLPILIHGDRLKVENGKVSLDGVLLN